MKNKLSASDGYNLILLAADLAVAAGAFSLGLWLTGWSFFLWRDIEATIGFIVLSLVTISFFQSYRLYNYHFLYSRKEHIKNLLKASGWSFLTLGLIVFFLNSSTLLETNFSLFLITLLCGAIVCLFLSRYFWSHLLDFLMAFGMAVFFFGITGLVCKNGIPVCMTNEFVIFICFLLASILLIINRLFLVHIVFFKWLRRRFRRQIVIIGSDSDVANITSHIVANNAPFWVVGTLGVQANRDLKFTRFKKNFIKEQLGSIDNLPDIVKKYNIDDIIITDESIDKTGLFSILDYCTSAGINAWFSPKLLPIIKMKLSLENFSGMPMILLCSQKHSGLFNRVKYCFDVLISLPLLLLLSPLLLFIAVAIKRDSPGPVLYRFLAIGENGVTYTMNKFRSMRVESDNKIHKDYVTQLIKGEIDNNGSEKTPLKIVDDPRVTRVGRLIRKFSMDELPQLINVLLGSMSLVGPRPCLPYEFEIYNDWHKKRTSVRPGITGLWQVTGRSEVTFEDMILLDLYYIYNRNLVLDFNILFETIFVVLEKKGAY
ncbi:exopolysaccharide biosynthesis polyprenyl glycosylphosphotransferase [Desulfopila sp. IMCC35006]|uniref:exopolysaccharide biosynthesis polyprenyl glycosylphosphotransferase n=1 Tax=Desulfopila sp. IMCC35006 TaxID=2569542 RepID=UPI0010ACC913|nr:exopolysaccharide biosynthesis polyprenyl glycosylphosphotransferase [Desulfopila sp. IMCC35006]TKB25004.1 exopolysaccharide biosynthesis polyprenyl glycosylphosphotransferase [Desulfopila sp. IMCC35006]